MFTHKLRDTHQHKKEKSTPHFWRPFCNFCLWLRWWWGSSPKSRNLLYHAFLVQFSLRHSGQKNLDALHHASEGCLPLHWLGIKHQRTYFLTTAFTAVVQAFYLQGKQVSFLHGWVFISLLAAAGLPDRWLPGGGGVGNSKGWGFQVRDSSWGLRQEQADHQGSHVPGALWSRHDWGWWSCCCCCCCFSQQGECFVCLRWVVVRMPVFGCTWTAGGKSPVEELAAVTWGWGRGQGVVEERGRFGKGCESKVSCHFQSPGWFERWERWVGGCVHCEV